MDTDAKLFYRKLLDFGPGVGMREGQRKFEEEMRRQEERKRIYNQDIGMSEIDKYLNAIQLAGAYTANPDSTFIKDPGGSGKLIKFTMPLDLRSVEEKMQRYPFVGAEGRFRA
jgi:hypothetical protein